MRNFLTKLISILVSNPEEVDISEKQEGSLLSFDIKVPTQDIGRVVGRNGNIIRAIRALAHLKATQNNQQVIVRLSEPAPTV